jgi:hypothetical protein
MVSINGVWVIRVLPGITAVPSLVTIAGFATRDD